jgi:hypothetical protein
MSHIATIKTEIKDLEAVKLACKELGLEFRENQKTCAFYPESGTPQQHPCDHAIKLPEGDFPMELGLVKTANGYDLVGDELLKISEEDGEHNGGFWVPKIFGMETNPLGTNYSKLLQLYAVNKATIESKKRGYLVKRQYVPGTQKIQLVVTGM